MADKVERGLYLGRDAEGTRIARIQENKDGSVLVSHGVLKPVEEGKPLQGDLVDVQPAGTFPNVAIRTLYSHSGPPKVTSKEYRENYDGIFGRARGSNLN